jgi:competence protein ComEC
VGRAGLLRLCLVVFFLALWPFLLRPRLPRLIVLTLTALIPLWGWQNRPRPQPARVPPAGLRVSFLDVGQGSAALIETADGALLVDAGPPEANVASQVAGLGIHRLEALVLSHPQSDHIGGAPDVLRRLDVGLVLDSGIPSSDYYEREARSEARRRRIPFRSAEAGQDLRLGALHVRILWPRAGATASASGDANESAVVVLASYGATDVLLPSDAESPITLPLALQPVEVLVVAHHGSADDGLESLLERLQPQVAVISVGRDNDYGHPTPSTLAALAAEPGLSVFRTDQDGRVVLESDGCAVSVRARGVDTVSLPCG